MISIKDYAEARSVTYEAVRRKVSIYKEELTGHIIKQGRSQYLDDIAVRFLDEHSYTNPVVIEERQEEIEELKAKTEALTVEIADKDAMIRQLEAQLEAAKKLTMELQSSNNLLLQEKVTLLEDKAEAARLIGAAEAEKAVSEARIKDLKEDAARERERADKAQEELQAERSKGFFARLFGL